MRYDFSEEDGDNLKVGLGHSHFLEYLESRNRTKDERYRLARLGTEIYRDRFAFFPRNPGVTGIVRTSDRRIIVGYRTSEGDPVFDGLVQGAATHLPYEKDPSRLNLRKVMREAYKNEFGLAPKNILSMDFLGLFSFEDQHGDDLDFGFLADTDLHSNYFAGDSWRSNADKINHVKLISLSNIVALRKLTPNGEIGGQTNNVIFSTRGPLEPLTLGDFK